MYCNLPIYSSQLEGMRQEELGEQPSCEGSSCPCPSEFMWQSWAGSSTACIWDKADFPAHLEGQVVGCLALPSSPLLSSEALSTQWCSVVVGGHLALSCPPTFLYERPDSVYETIGCCG